MIGGLGIGEIIIILFVIVVLYAGSRLGGVGAGLGKAINNFRKEMKGASGRGESGK